MSTYLRPGPLYKGRRKGIQSYQSISSVLCDWCGVLCS